ncbi:MAG: SGNH/GDSL hydrolase family protein [Lachnospiraceae bacterium]|nr:SGNH/GDSL hydrolase family protein [Lachnospiraceae bacterium]
MQGPKAPKDPTKKRKSFFIMRNKAVAGAVQPAGNGIQFIYLNDGRMISSAKIVGGISDENMLELLKTTEGFRKLVHSIGITVEADDREKQVDFVFQMYGKTNIYGSGTNLRKSLRADGMENILVLDECNWSEDDDIPGQIRFEFKTAGEFASVSVRFYLQDGFDAPEPEEEEKADFSSPYYQEMLEQSLIQVGNNVRLKKAIDKAKAGEDVTIAFIGGSITQGAGAIPINTQCYAYKTFRGLCELAGKGTEENIHYIKAGVGGTPSELGMLRYERDVLRNGTVTPDIVVVEFAVNDAGDETNGECYDSLVRKILSAQNAPAVILLFAVFADDFNLQDRLIPVGKAYNLPMISTKNAVVEQFYKKPGEGKVVSKGQFFYDSFHPTNVGHTVMADGLIHLLKTVDAQPADKEDIVLEKIPAPIGGEFQNVKLLAASQNNCNAVIDVGDFTDCDSELQCVEQDLNLVPTPEFPDNWMYKGSEKKGEGKAFSMDITCSALLLIFKDSASPNVGCAQVFVDGEMVLFANPKINGWTHCNPAICFRGREKKSYHVEVKMQPGDEDKNFTILGFGYVED